MSVALIVNQSSTPLMLTQNGSRDRAFTKMEQFNGTPFPHQRVGHRGRACCRRTACRARACRHAQPPGIELSQTAHTAFGAAEVFAERVAEMAGRKFPIFVNAGGELIPAFEVVGGAATRCPRDGTHRRRLVFLRQRSDPLSGEFSALRHERTADDRLDVRRHASNVLGMPSRPSQTADNAAATT